MVHQCEEFVNINVEHIFVSCAEPLVCVLVCKFLICILVKRLYNRCAFCILLRQNLVYVNFVSTRIVIDIDVVKSKTAMIPNPFVYVWILKSRYRNYCY